MDNKYKFPKMQVADILFIVNKQKNMIEAPIRAMFYLMTGVTGEVVYTAIKYNIIMDKDWKLQGFTQLWTMPLYAVGGIYVFEPIYRYISDWHILFRFIVYVILIYIVEYIASFLIEKLIRKRPWDYTKQMCNLHGRITCVHFPFWGGIGILFEIIYKFLISL